VSNKFKVGDRVRHSHAPNRAFVVRRVDDDGDLTVDDGNRLSLGLFARDCSLIEAAPVPVDCPVRVKLFPGGKLPERKTEGAAGWDLFATVENDAPQFAAFGEVVVPAARPDNCKGFDGHFIKPVVKIPLGVAFEIPPGYVGKLYSRSSMGLKGVVIPNGVGIIDSDYRGEVAALLMNLSGEDFVVKDGQAIAQICFERCPTVSLEVVDELSPTARGEGGFGSTGSGVKKGGE